jgi:hypothetical protein
MNTREKFLKILNFEKVDRNIDWEFAYWGGTLNRWYKEGLPRLTGFPRELEEGETIGGPGLYWSEDNPWLYAYDVDKYFNFDEGLRRPPINTWIFPQYEVQVISDDERKKEIIDADGIRKIIMKNSSSMPLWLEWPVKDRKSWEKIRDDRLNLGKDSIDKRILINKELMISKIKNRSYPIGLIGYPAGFFGSLRFLIGDTNLFMLYYDDPKLLKDILKFLTDFWINCCDEILNYFDVDVMLFWEDMAGRNGSLISPKLFIEFMLPFYKRIINHLREKGLKNFMVDTDGKIDELVPLFLEAGITCIYPFERQAGNNLLEFRKKYPKMQMMGGFNKNVLAQSREQIDIELNIISEVLKYGGYILTADHLIPPNVSFENFKYYRNKIKNIL